MHMIDNPQGNSLAHIGWNRSELEMGASKVDLIDTVSISCLPPSSKFPQSDRDQTWRLNKLKLGTCEHLRGLHSATL